jgi:hypothetical protein
VAAGFRGRRHLGLIDGVVGRRKIHRDRRHVVADFIRGVDVDVSGNGGEVNAEHDDGGYRPTP